MKLQIKKKSYMVLSKIVGSKLISVNWQVAKLARVKRPKFKRPISRQPDRR